eukprot:CAMPEP_0118655064 /NCGR_PEP_ID=MMETSP0785-20121206/12722_1 /TAXON_ID=91992 /ORGANISM="Bolidomonas pacifica, Strain CCMP 1866" /LENGTH=364 /DNA_ID=CAMNT_0006547763 /DNA_START=17 /DNA_END=1111 /DNA_ORIENTATION=-
MINHPHFMLAGALLLIVHSSKAWFNPTLLPSFPLQQPTSPTSSYFTPVIPSPYAKRHSPVNSIALLAKKEERELVEDVTASKDEEEEGEEEEVKEGEVVEDDEEEEDAEEVVEAKEGDEGEEGEEGEEEKEEEEDPEIKALKEEIAELTTKLSASQLKASTIRSKASGFSKDSYVRLAAEADNFKKVRARSGKQSESIHIASTIKKFLPIYDEITKIVEEGKDSESEDANNVAKGYGSLGSSMMTCFKELGMTEYHAVVEEKFDASKHSEAGPREVCGPDFSVEDGFVLREVSMGYEVKGSTVRKAGVILAMSEEGDKVDGDEGEGEEVGRYGTGRMKKSLGRKRRREKDESEDVGCIIRKSGP